MVSTSCLIEDAEDLVATRRQVCGVGLRAGVGVMHQNVPVGHDSWQQVDTGVSDGKTGCGLIGHLSCGLRLDGCGEVPADVLRLFRKAVVVLADRDTAKQIDRVVQQISEGHQIGKGSYSGRLMTGSSGVTPRPTESVVSWSRFGFRLATMAAR